MNTEHAPKRRSKDDNAAPGGNLIAVAAGALVLRKMFGGATTLPAQPMPTNAPAGSILSGLTDLIGKLTASGVVQVNSWVGQGANEPVQPGQLGSALGQSVLNELSQRTGMSQQELLNQLATVLPQLINHLTPNGRMPTLADLEKDDSADLLVGVGSRVANSTSEVTEAAPLDISSYLDSDEVIAEYLTAAAEDENQAVFMTALGEVAKARGMKQIAEAAGLGRESLYKALVPGANPRFETIRAVLRAMNVRLSLHASVSPKLAKAHRKTSQPNATVAEKATAKKRATKKAAAKRPAPAKRRA